MFIAAYLDKQPVQAKHQRFVLRQKNYAVILNFLIKDLTDELRSKDTLNSSNNLALYKQKNGRKGNKNNKNNKDGKKSRGLDNTKYSGYRIPNLRYPKDKYLGSNTELRKEQEYKNSKKWLSYN